MILADLEQALGGQAGIRQELDRVLERHHIIDRLSRSLRPPAGQPRAFPGVARGDVVVWWHCRDWLVFRLASPRPAGATIDRWKTEAGLGGQRGISFRQLRRAWVRLSDDT